MKISYNWLKKYVDIDIDPQKLEDVMTFGGIEVEAVEKLGKNLEQILIGKIEEKHKHPNADKLAICKVNNGSETLQVICGAPNCESGQKIAFAPIGTKLGEFKIKKAKLRGEESFGMICSEQELGISDNHDGIMVLPEDAPLGNTLASYLEIKDTCYDVEITPNRPDLLGMIGVARDVAALTNKTLQLPEIKFEEGSVSIEDHLQLENKAEDLCTRYTARLIKGVKIKESPDWLKKNLIAVGIKPINNVVDVTNFVMMEYGHPLHAFDHKDINGSKIIVRRAESGEKFPALNDKTYELEKTDLVIADAEKAVALAGVIGGVNSHITETTKDIVLEAANFHYAGIRNTGKKFNISTDSSYRFERDIADEMAEIVSRRATQLILEFAGGTLCKGLLDSYPNPQKSNEVTIRRSRVKKILTIDISSRQIKSYLEALDLELLGEKNDVQTYKIPPFRKDLTREIDLIEEVIRLHGYNNVKTHLKLQSVMNKREFYDRRKVKETLVEKGFSEIKNWKFANPEDLDLLRIEADDKRRNFAHLKNPLGSSFSIMQSMLIPDILNNAKFNINHGQKDLKIFEQAKVFTRKEQKLADENFQVTGLMTGFLNPAFWKEQRKEADFFDLKGILEDLLSKLGIQDVIFELSTEPFYLPGQAADCIFKGKKIGSLGKVDPKVAREFEIEQEILIFDIFLSRIFRLHKPEVMAFRDIPKFPPVLRDLSFLIPKNYEYLNIIKFIKTLNKNIQQVELFDEYTGKNVPQNFRSLTFNLIFSSSTKTLTDEYINSIIKTVIKKLKNKFQIELR